MLSIGLHGQEASSIYDDHHFSIGVDVNGLALMPLISSTSLDEGHFIRSEVQLQFSSGSGYFVELAIGRDVRVGAPVYENVYDLDHRSSYFIFLGGYDRQISDDLQSHFSIGILHGWVSEDGEIRIGGDYFAPYSEEYSFTFTTTQFVTGTGLRFNLSEQLHLGGAVYFHIGGHTDDSDRAVIYTPGGGRNAFPTGGAVMTWSPRINLGYTF